MIKKSFFGRNIDKINIFSFSSITRLKQDATHTSDILFSAFKNTFVIKGFICFIDIFIHKQFSSHGFIKKSIFVTNIDKINNL